MGPDRGLHVEYHIADEDLRVVVTAQDRSRAQPRPRRRRRQAPGLRLRRRIRRQLEDETVRIDVDGLGAARDADRDVTGKRIDSIVGSAFPATDSAESAESCVIAPTGIRTVAS